MHAAMLCITDRTRVTFLLGLTGNIACGKSTVGALLAREFGAEYLDADRVVHALYAPGSPQTRAIAQRFGSQLVQEDGTIDRRGLGDIVLKDPAALRELERILDPAVRTAITDRLQHTSAAVLVLDAIRLLESGLAERCDAIWVVTCEASEQAARLQSARNFTAEQAALRIASQRPQREKAERATAVIHNGGTLDDLAAQVQQAWRRTVAPFLGHERNQRDQSSAP
jgi:dephospho-CoA kinase